MATSAKVAVLGASGIGKFHARDLQANGCEVVAILGSSPQTAEATAEKLKEFNVNAKPFHHLPALLQQDLDAVSVCTPPEEHSAMVEKCLEANLHVMCEKPFVFDADVNAPRAQALVDLAKKKGKVLAVNTQWPSILPQLPIPSPLTSFSMYMEPCGKDARTHILEALPHMNSVLLKLLPAGKTENLTVEVGQLTTIAVDWAYPGGPCKVKFELVGKEERPRAFKVTFNEDEYVRELGENYEQSLVCKGESFPIKDPLTESIKRFVEALDGGQPLVSTEEIVQNVSLMDQVIADL